jgi:hypothetical protein
MILVCGTRTGPSAVRRLTHLLGQSETQASEAAFFQERFGGRFRACGITGWKAKTLLHGSFS